MYKCQLSKEEITIDSVCIYIVVTNVISSTFGLKEMGIELATKWKVDNLLS